MASKGLAGLLAVSSYLLLATFCRAECKADQDCAGDLVCDDQQCVAPAPPPPAPTAPAAGTRRPAIDAEPPARPREPPAKPKMRRHSPAMMVGGIVMTSVGGISLAVSGVTAFGALMCKASEPSDSRGGGSGCSSNDGIMYASLVLGLGLVAGGVPMLVIGAKREPIGYAGITAWTAPHAGGFSLRLEL